MSAITLENVSKSYRMGQEDLPVLRGINLTIEAGEFAAIMGPSGSGKSTLLHLMGALDRPTSGRVVIAGSDVAELSDVDLSFLRNRMLGFVFQNFNLLSYYTAFENVCLPLVYSGTNQEDYEFAKEILIHVGLGERLRHKPHELSGGERQRVAMARALVNRPHIILADEPTGNLDSKNGETIMGFLQEINRAGTTVVLITHDSSVASYAHRVFRIQDGVFQ